MKNSASPGSVSRHRSNPLYYTLRALHINSLIINYGLHHGKVHSPSAELPVCVHILCYLHLMHIHTHIYIHNVYLLVYQCGCLCVFYTYVNARLYKDFLLDSDGHETKEFGVIAGGPRGVCESHQASGYG